MAGGGCRTPLGIVWKPDGATLGVPPRPAVQLDTSVGVTWGALACLAGCPRSQGWDGQQECVVVPRSCGYGPRAARRVGAMGKQPSHQQPISGRHLCQASLVTQGGLVVVSARSRRPRPARGGGQASPSHTRFTFVDNRSEGLSLPFLARQLVPWAAKWQCCECRH
jgi:hypothetical protein